MKIKNWGIWVSPLILAVGLFSGYAIGRSAQDVSLKTMLNIFGKTIRIIQDDYVTEKRPNKLVEKAIEGMVNSLDPFSEFLTPEESEEWNIHTSGNFGGIGIQIGMRDRILTVIAPIDGTPAKKAGLMSGDKIVEIEGKKTRGMKLQEAVHKLRGEPGTKVRIKVARKGVKELLNFELTRAIIHVKSVPFARMLNPNIGYIRYSQFMNNSTGEFVSALNALKDSGATKFVIDLRGNPGGLLREAVRTASLFVGQDKVVVSTRGRNPGSVSVRRSIPEGDTYLNSPVVILTDRGTASASEIVSGCLQDWDRGIILGDTTFGKGSVQRIFPLDYGYQVKITIAKYYTPSGRCIHRERWENGDEDTTISKGPYKTKILNRNVYGGGGIAPDVFMRGDTITPIVSKLYAKSAFFNFAIEYKLNHKALPKRFTVSSNTLNMFKKFLKKQKIEYRQNAFAGSKKVIARAIGMSLYEVYYGDEGRYDYITMHDPVVSRAKTILNNINSIKGTQKYLKKLEK